MEIAIIEEVRNICYAMSPPSYPVLITKKVCRDIIWLLKGHGHVFLDKVIFPDFNVYYASVSHLISNKNVSVICWVIIKFKRLQFFAIKTKLMFTF